MLLSAVFFCGNLWISFFINRERGKEMDNQNAVVVFSGGQDSTTCLFWALKKFDHVEVVTFQYGQRHIAELECAKEICARLNVRQHQLDMELLNQLAPNALTRENIKITDYEGMPSTFVPGRIYCFYLLPLF